MAELLVVWTDKTNPDSIYLDTKLPKRGDVIVARDDGWQWGDGELTDPGWRILKLPGVPVSHLSMMLSGEPATSPDEWLRPNTLQYRAFYLDSKNVLMPPDFTAYLEDDSRAQAFYTVPGGLSLADVAFQRPKVDDPAVFGQPANILG